MSRNQPPGPTVLGYSRTRLLRILLGFPAVGLGLGLLLPPPARWTDGSATGTLGRVVDALGGLDQPWQVALCAGAATALGLLAAYVAVADSARLTVSDSSLGIDPRDGKKASALAREDVAAVYPEGRDLVVLDAAGRQLARTPRQASRHALARTLRAHGYPWRDSRPATPARMPAAA
ncbi:hypothetical protein ACIQM4_12420 [Streptomyces sp. NPDC091272]|uniref:YqeB family protein n=1 Tax=Streptomyces sp. NPDC091272 TaxID=3365981 RepID=UPI0038097188